MAVTLLQATEPIFRYEIFGNSSIQIQFLIFIFFKNKEQIRDYNRMVKPEAYVVQMVKREKQNDVIRCVA